MSNHWFTVVGLNPKPPKVGEATDDRYWDCGCRVQYIHPKSDAHCPKCGHHYNPVDYADSLASEVADSAKHYFRANQGED